jgi:hypothetical protein
VSAKPPDAEDGIYSQAVAMVDPRAPEPMRVEVSRGQVFGLGVASGVFALGIWLYTGLYGLWAEFAVSVVVMLAFLWGVGLWVLSRYRDEWGPVLFWNWRRKDPPDEGE